MSSEQEEPLPCIRCGELPQVWEDAETEFTYSCGGDHGDSVPHIYYHVGRQGELQRAIHQWNTRQRLLLGHSEDSLTYFISGVSLGHPFEVNAPLIPRLFRNTTPLGISQAIVELPTYRGPAQSLTGDGQDALHAALWSSLGRTIEQWQRGPLAEPWLPCVSEGCRVVVMPDMDAVEVVWRWELVHPENGIGRILVDRKEAGGLAVFHVDAFGKDHGGHKLLAMRRLADLRDRPVVYMADGSGWRWNRPEQRWLPDGGGGSSVNPTGQSGDRVIVLDE